MKVLVNIARFLVGGLFIFSGLVKAIDPKGLSYKMEEFFEVWASDGYLPSLMNYFHQHSTLFSVLMISLEVLLGVALLVGWQKKITSWLLILLIVFFTFLTSYVLFSGKIRACGCFGDCIPLTPIQTFSKDIALLLLILFLLFQQSNIAPLFKSWINSGIVLISTVAVVGLQIYVMKHLPIKDCLPYKAGNDILALRQMPANAIPDVFEYHFIYKKGDLQKEFLVSNLPDSSWTYVDRKEILVKKGSNNIPAINDFSLSDSTGLDVTETVLSQPNTYYLLFIKNVTEGDGDWLSAFDALYQKAAQQKIPLYIVTANKDKATQLFHQEKKYNVAILTADGTAIKTAARVSPTLFVMNKSVVQAKYGWADMLQGLR